MKKNKMKSSSGLGNEYMKTLVNRLCRVGRWNNITTEKAIMEVSKMEKLDGCISFCVCWDDDLWDWNKNIPSLKGENLPNLPSGRKLDFDNCITWMFDQTFCHPELYIKSMILYQYGEINSYHCDITVAKIAA